MNELKLDNFRGTKHEWIVASHKNKRLFATAFYVHNDKISVNIVFRVTQDDRDVAYLTTLAEAIVEYNKL